MLRLKFVPVAVTAIACLASLAQAQTTIAPTGGTREYYFAPAGIAASETASITVVNTAVPAASSTAEVPIMPSCTGTLSFMNQAGDIGAPIPFTLESKQFTTTTLPFAKAGFSGLRGELVGRISLNVSGTAPCSLVSSFEIYDTASGVTHAALSNPSANSHANLPVVVLDPRPPR